MKMIKTLNKGWTLLALWMIFGMLTDTYVSTTSINFQIMLTVILSLVAILATYEIKIQNKSWRIL